MSVIKKLGLLPVVLLVGSFYAPVSARLSFEELSKVVQPPKKSVITLEEFEETIESFLSTYTRPKVREWLGYPAVKKVVDPASRVVFHADFHGDKKAMFNLIQKLNDSGDLEGFKIAKGKDNFYIVLAGDFVDRGPDGLEVLYAAMRLRIENPENVVILRGNHETDAVGEDFKKELKSKLGIAIDDSDEKLAPIYTVMPVVFYLGTKGDSCINYVMFTHGAIEPRFNPAALLKSKKDNDIVYIKELDISSMENEEFTKTIDSVLEADLRSKPGKVAKPEKGAKPGKVAEPIISLEKFNKVGPNEVICDTHHLGFLWSDFIVKEAEYSRVSERLLRATGGTAIFLSYNKDITKKYLDLISNGSEYKVNAIIRGHQHGGELATKMIENKGIYELWDVKQWDGNPNNPVSIPKYSVWTLLASPATFGGAASAKENPGLKKPDFDTYAILKLDKNFEKWELQPVSWPIK